MTNYPPYNDQELLQEIAKGNEQAFRHLFDRYRPKLYTYLLRMTESREMAEDSVHDVFLKLWSNREKLTDIENLNAYLYRMAHNHAFNGLRKMATETLVLAEISGRGYAVPEDPDHALGRKEVRQFIREMVDKLSPRQKEVFLLSRDGGLRQAEIAEKLGITVSTVKAHLTDALNHLREEISARYGTYAIAIFVCWNLGH